MVEIQENILNKVIKKRKSASHKGNYGKLLLIGGSSHYGGAVIMAAEGALNSGGYQIIRWHSSVCRLSCITNMILRSSL